MKSYDSLKAEIEVTQQQKIASKKNEPAFTLKEVKSLCHRFGFTAGMPKGSIGEGHSDK